MTEHPFESVARQVLEGSLLVAGIAADEARVSRVGLLVASLLDDGERLTTQADLETEPFLITRLARRDLERQHVDR